MPTSQSLIATTGISIGILLLGIPIAVTTVTFAHVYVPKVALSMKEINIGPSGTKTLTFGPLSAPNDAVLSAAYISVISSVLCAAGIFSLDHPMALGKE